MAEPRWTDTVLDRLRTVGDPAADLPVSQVMTRGGLSEVNAIMRTLVRTEQPVPAELPAELATYFTDTLALPAWADSAAMLRGQRVFEKWGLYIALCLYCASLPSSYAAANGVQVLHLTARLDTDPRRRILETGQFLFDVLSPGGLDDDGKGRRTIQRVRLMHAAVRHLIAARSATDPDVWQPQWGSPLNQEDLAGTLLSFSCVVVEPLRRLGVHLSTRDVAAYLHLWNVIGYMLGVREELLPNSPEEALELIDAIKRRQFRASPEGQQLTAALLNLLDELTPLHQFDDSIPPLIRHLIGEETADLLLIPKATGVDELGLIARCVDWFLVHVLGWTERSRPRYHLMANLARPLGIDVLRGMYAFERGGERAPFDLPDHLARKLS